MLEEFKKQITSVQILVALLSIAAAIYLFQILWQTLSIFSDIFGMLIFAWVLSFLLEPLVDKLNRFTKMPKVISALVIFAAFFGLLTVVVTLFIPAVASQIDSLQKVLPHYLSSSPIYVRHMADSALSTLNNSFLLIPSVASFLLSLFIALLISFYFVVDKEKINKEFLSLVPKKWHEHVIYVQQLIDTTFGSFLRIQLIFGLIAGVITWALLRLLNVDFAASTAVVSGILTVIPLVGGPIGLIPPVLIAFLADPVKGLIVFLVLLIMQNVLFNIVGPKLLGKALQLHPVIVLLSFFVGYKIAGGIGAIFAVPVLGVLFVITHQLSHHFLAAPSTNSK